MYSHVFGRVFSIAIVFECTLTTLALLPLIGWLMLIMFFCSFTSIHLSFAASDVLAAVSFSTCRKAAVFLPQPAIN